MSRYDGHFIVTAPKAMRASLSVILLLLPLFSACGTSKEPLAKPRQIDQSGLLKIHPGLLPADTAGHQPGAAAVDATGQNAATPR